MAGDIIYGLIFGFLFGMITMGFLVGNGWCGNCWLALIRGKRHENGCADCVGRIYNQYPTMNEKALEEER